MKIPTPVLEPSGRWRVQVYADGKKQSKTFDTKTEAAAWAAEMKLNVKRVRTSPQLLTVSETMKRYVDSKAAVLSPSTVRGYLSIIETLVKGRPFAGIYLKDLTQENVQLWVNDISKTTTPKTVANAHGLLSASLRAYFPEFRLQSTLPKKYPHEIKIPTSAELRALFCVLENTHYYLPVSLAAWMGLRQSEILGLRWRDIKGAEMHITNVIVRGDDGETEKRPKSAAGKRVLPIPKHIQKLLQERGQPDEHIVTLSAAAIYHGFQRGCENAGFSEHYRFHDLRHFQASALLAAGVPDKYAAEIMGH